VRWEDLVLLQAWMSRGYVRLANVPNAGGFYFSNCHGRKNVVFFLEPKFLKRIVANIAISASVDEKWNSGIANAGP